MKFAKIQFDSRDDCAEAIHEISARGRVVALRGDYFIVPEPAIQWLDLNQYSYHLVEWLNWDDVVQTLRNLLAQPVQ